jgi:hypothetical protein
MTTQAFSLADKDFLIEQLKSNVVEVDFVKADGTDRTMRCTLKADLVPKVDIKIIDTTKPSRKAPENVIPVYDLDNEGWRSFRIDSIKTVTVRK